MEGRFISKDPIGFRGGFNLYRYVQNNPINSSDPFGLYSAGDVTDAWNHYCDGSGTSWSTSFSSINWGDSKSKIYEKIKSMVSGCRANSTIPVNFTYSAQTEGADKYIIGRHNLRVKGTIKVNKDCTWTFTGDMSSSRGYDPYDFDPSNRGPLGEALTWVGRNSCSEDGATFNIYLPGSEPLSFGGRVE